MLSGSSRHTGKRVCCAAKNVGDDLFWWIVAVDRVHFGAMLHKVVEFEIAEIEDTAEPFGIAMIDDAIAGRQFNRAAQFSMREHIGVVIARDRGEAHDQCDEPFDDAASSAGRSRSGTP